MSAVEGLVTYHMLLSTEERERETRGKSGGLSEREKRNRYLTTATGEICNGSVIRLRILSSQSPNRSSDQNLPAGGWGSAAFMTEALISAAVGSKSEGLPKSGL